MLTRLCIEALLVHEELTDEVWEAWDKGEIDDMCASISWIIIADQKEIRLMSRLPGLFPSGGFTRDAEKEAREQEKRRLTLLDLEAMFDLWKEYYDQIPEEERRLLPLRFVSYLALLFRHHRCW